MPHGRMQHIAALPCGKSCSAYVTNINLFVPTLKKNFFANYIQGYKNCGTDTEKNTVNFIWFFIWMAVAILKPVTHYMLRWKLCLHDSWQQILVWQTTDETDTLLTR